MRDIPVEGNQIRSRREKQLMSQARLAEAVGMSDRRILEIEKGTPQSVHPETFQKFLHVFGCTAPDIMPASVCPDYPSLGVHARVHPDVHRFIEQKEVGMAAWDEYLQLECSPGWRGWRRGQVQLSASVRDYIVPEELKPFMEYFTPEPGKPRNFYYSLHSWNLPNLEPIHEDATKEGEEPKLKLQATGGRWDHVLALNGIWKSVRQDEKNAQLKQDCERFRDRFVGDILLIRAGRSRLYHQMNTEVILVTSDDKVVITRRPGISEFSHGLWTASLEEQLLREKDDPNNRQSDGGDLFHCAHRGTQRELRVSVIPEETRLLSFGVEWGNFTAAFLFLIRCEERYSRVLETWPTAPERAEAVAVDCLDIADLEEAIKSEHWQPRNARSASWVKTNAVEAARWHPVAQARLVALNFHRQSLRP
jgi:DNA-binding XRE family transcriptional regulator